MMRLVLALCSAAVLLTALAAAPAPAAGPQRTFERSFAVASAVTLDAGTNSGRVDVRIGGDRTVTVRGTIKRNVSWRGFHVADGDIDRLRTAPPVRADAGTVRIERIADEALWNGVSIDYEIVVPATTRIAVVTSSGGVSIAGSRESLRVETGSGAIHVQAAAGAAVLRSGSGSLRVAGTLDSLAMRTQSGSILAETDSVGAVEVESGSGSITVSGVRGSLRAETGSSSITLGGVPAGDWSVRSRSGSVSIRLPADSRFDLVARSRSGSVKAAHRVVGPSAQSKHAVEGAVNGGGPKLEVETGSSSISIGS
jgi:hypothetical protein